MIFAQARRFRRTMLGNAAILCFLTYANGQVISGAVFNATKEQPAVGDAVLLLDGGRQLDRAITLKDGSFSVLDTPTDHPAVPVLRVVHGGVNYDQIVQSGEKNNMVVYDSARVVQGIGAYICILQFQTHAHNLEVTELHSVRNDSTPPITQVNLANLDLVIPDGASVQSSIVSGPSREATAILPIPVRGEPNHYRFPYPLFPGLTRYVIVYNVPYQDQLLFQRKLEYSTSQFSLMLPTSMHAAPIGATRFEGVLNEKGIQVLPISSPTKGETIRFALRGSGAMVRYLSPKPAPHSTISELPKPFSVNGVAEPAKAQTRPIPIPAEVRGKHRTWIWLCSLLGLGIAVRMLLANRFRKMQVQ
jgi:hypothetical protein